MNRVNILAIINSRSYVLELAFSCIQVWRVSQNRNSLFSSATYSVTSFYIPDITSELENLVFRLFSRTYYSSSWSNCILFSSHSTLRHKSQTCEFISALSDQMKMWIRSVSRRQQFSSNKFDWAPEPNSNYHHNSSKGIEST